MTIKQKLPDKFYGTKPLIMSMYCSSTFYLYDHPFRSDPTGMRSLYQGRSGEKMENKNYNFVYGTNAREEKLVKHDFLYQIDGSAKLAHRRVLDKLKEVCPNDFQAFPATIKNIKKKNPYFENHDYYVLHIIPLIDAIDKDKSLVEIRILKSAAEWWEVRNITLKENCMGKHLLAKVKHEEGITICAPELAREFASTPGTRFYADREHSSWWENALPYEAPPKLRQSKKTVSNSTE